VSAAPASWFLMVSDANLVGRELLYLTEIYVLMLKLHLPETEIETGYGNRWPGEMRDLNCYRTLAEEPVLK